MGNGIIKPIFADKQPNPARLAAYGFVPRGEGFSLSTAIDIGNTGERFAMTVLIDGQGVRTRLVDADGGEYVLHRSEAAAGAFVGAVREAHDSLLRQIAESCFDQAVFKAPQSLALIDHVRQTYGGELEFLWERLPQAAIWRRYPSRKWYAALIIIGRDKLGLAGSEPVEIIDLHCPAADMAGRLAAGALPGYHMNKKYWFTVALDGSVDLELICQWLAASYDMAK